MWPSTAAALIELQDELAARPAPEAAFDPSAPVGGCFACFGRGGTGAGRAGDSGWAGAALVQSRRALAAIAVAGAAGGPYAPGLLALREGPLLAAAVRHLPFLPPMLLVDGTGRDHPRWAGLAVHLGVVLGVPTVGVTHRPLLAEGEWPADRRGAASPLRLHGRLVGFWLRTREGARPLAVHAAWGTSPETAVEVVLAATGRARTPEPLRAAREAARRGRAAAVPPA